MHVSRFLVALVLVLTGSAMTFAATPDSWLTMKTKIALMTADNIHTSELNVDTNNGIVTCTARYRRKPRKPTLSGSQ